MSISLNNKDYIWSFIGTFLSVGSGIIMLPFILYYLSEDMYGLWSVFQSIAGITALFDFGFSTTFARNINYCYSGARRLKKTGVEYSYNRSPNFRLMKITMTSCRYVFLIISLVALLCMMVPGTVYILKITEDIFSSSVIISWAFYAVAIFFNLYFGYYSSFLQGVGAVYRVNKARVYSRIVQIVLTVLSLVLGFGIVGTAFSYMFYGLSFRLLARKYFLNFNNIGSELDDIKEKPGFSELKETFLTVWHNAKREGIITLSNYLSDQACTIISPMFLSLGLTGMYSLATQLSNVLGNVSATLYSASQPVLQSAQVTGNKRQVKETMSLIVVSFVLLYFAGMAMIVVIGLPILRALKPETAPTLSIMIGVGVYHFILKFRNCYTSYFSSQNRLPYVISFLISSVICVVGAVVLLRYFNLGIWGLILAQIISQMIYNAWHWAIEAHREMQLGIRETITLGVKEIKLLLSGIFKRQKGEQDA